MRDPQNVVKVMEPDSVGVSFLPSSHPVALPPFFFFLAVFCELLLLIFVCICGLQPYLGVSLVSFLSWVLL